VAHIITGMDAQELRLTIFALFFFKFSYVTMQAEILTPPKRENRVCLDYSTSMVKSTWCTILRSHTHSRDAPNNDIVSEWLVDVATIVCFEDFQEIAVPSCMKTNPVCDLAS
jgi:hypothetical protein